jgi:hypothetical protein
MALAAIFGGLACILAFVLIVFVAGAPRWDATYLALPACGVLWIAAGLIYLWRNSPFNKG